MIYKKNQINRKKVWTLWPLWPPECSCPLLRPFIAIQDSCRRSKWTGNTYSRPYLDPQGMARVWPPECNCPLFTANRTYSIWYDFQEKQNRSKTSGTSGTSGTVEYRIHNLLPFIAIQGFYRKLELTDNIWICPTSTKTSGTKSRTSGTAK